MNHLKTEEERKKRWFATHIRPRFVKVTAASDWNEFTSFDADAKSSSYDTVTSLPFDWISSDNDPKFLRDALHASLDTHGFLVVSNVLTEEACQSALDLAWDWLEAASVAEYAV